MLSSEARCGVKWYCYGEEISCPCALLLGAFDGLHLGHRALLSAAKKTGLPIVITTMIGGKGKQLFTREERKFVFSHTGIDCVYEIPFTDVLRETAAEKFLSELFGKINVKAVFCGEDYRFGKGALGDWRLLKEYCGNVTVAETILSGGEKVSTSGCKRLVAEKDFATLRVLLDEEADSLYDRKCYFIGGIVEHGRQVGRTYGFPTLNLSLPPEKLLPPDGVYAGFAVTPKGTFRSIVNIGARPTFGVEEKKIEAYLDGFSGDLYGAAVRVYPTKFLRPVSRFESKEALKEQLQRDKESLVYVL